MENIYSIQKILYHLDKIKELREGKQLNPVQIHLMPNNSCNQNCSWCNYRIEGNKNTQLFGKSSYIPKEVMLQLLDDFKGMGGKAIENTGGGSPLLYPYKKEMYERIIKHEFDHALVTNGTLLDEEFAAMITPTMTWARVSIDCATPKTYESMRRVNGNNIFKAWNAIKLLRKYSNNPQFKLGVGFVISNENYKEVYEGCKQAKEAGADNVRIGAVFHPDKLKYFNNKTIKIGKELSKKAEELNDKNFKVYNLFNERIHNLEIGKQDYKFCGTKELLCVVGGNCDVYTCCSLAFNKKGLIGNLKNKSFKELWNSEEKKRMFKNFDASKICNYMCLYESRNKYINKLLENHLHKRSEERRVGKECRSRWSPYH